MTVDLSFSRFCNGKSSWEKVAFSLQPNKRHLYSFSLYKLFWFVWANSIVSYVSLCFMFFWETIVNVRYNKMKLKSLKSTDIWISFALQSGDSYPKKWKRNLSTFSFRQELPFMLLTFLLFLGPSKGTHEFADTIFTKPQLCAHCK